MLNEFYHLYGLNRDLFIFINSFTNFSILPYILQWVSSIFFIGNFALAYIAICIYQYYKLKKSDNVGIDYWKIYFPLVKIGTIYAYFGLIYAALKFNVNMPRPFCALDSYQYITIIDIAGERCLSSFPSAHTALALLICYFLWPYVKNLTRILLLLLVVIVGISRITLAMHFPVDIFWSLFITIAIIGLGNFSFIILKEILIEPVGKFIYHALFKPNERKECPKKHPTKKHQIL